MNGNSSSLVISDGTQVEADASLIGSNNARVIIHENGHLGARPSWSASSGLKPVPTATGEQLEHSSCSNNEECIRSTLGSTGIETGHIIARELRSLWPSFGSDDNDVAVTPSGKLVDASGNGTWRAYMHEYLQESTMWTPTDGIPSCGPTWAFENSSLSDSARAVAISMSLQDSCRRMLSSPDEQLTVAQLATKATEFLQVHVPVPGSMEDLKSHPSRYSIELCGAIGITLEELGPKADSVLQDIQSANASTLPLSVVDTIVDAGFMDHVSLPPFSSIRFLLSEGVAPPQPLSVLTGCMAADALGQLGSQTSDASPDFLPSEEAIMEMTSAIPTRNALLHAGMGIAFQRLVHAAGRSVDMRGGLELEEGATLSVQSGLSVAEGVPLSVGSAVVADAPSMLLRAAKGLMDQDIMAISPNASIVESILVRPSTLLRWTTGQKSEALVVDFRSSRHGDNQTDRNQVDGVIASTGAPVIMDGCSHLVGRYQGSGSSSLRIVPSTMDQSKCHEMKEQAMEAQHAMSE